MPQFIPAPAAGGGGASFLFDGATFTLGEFVADSGARDVTVEFTLDSNSIASGTIKTEILLLSDASFDNITGTTESFLALFFAGPTTAGFLFGSVDNGYEILFVTASGGSCTITISLMNSTNDPVPVYMAFTLPNGGVTVSGEISIPGVPA